jgi:hypothetical protein
MKAKGICLDAGRPKRTLLIFALTAALSMLPATVCAGPPFVTDDPFPLPIHTGEFYLFASGTNSRDGVFLDAAPGVELNYSFLRNTFFHSITPLSYAEPSGAASAYGLGDIELGFKWRFLKQANLRPDVGIFPFLEVPSGDKERGLGNGHPQLFLPLWLGGNKGPWTAYGGGGYWINPGSGNRNWWFTGGVLQRQINDKLYLGVELFHQTPDTTDGSSSTGFNVGGGLTVAGPYQILFSAGRNIENTSANRFSFYIALYRTF